LANSLKFSPTKVLYRTAAYFTSIALHMSFTNRRLKQGDYHIVGGTEPHSSTLQSKALCYARMHNKISACMEFIWHSYKFTSK